MEENKEILQRIQEIISAQFDEEIEYKEEELDIINERIYETKTLLDELRAAIVTKYYAAQCSLTEENVVNATVHPVVREYFAGKSLPQGVAHPEAAKYELPVKLGSESFTPNAPSAPKRLFKAKQNVKFVVGNISKYIGDEDPDDSATHKWMAYVRFLPEEELKIEDVVSKVRYFLHPSYSPHHIVDVTYPFHLKRKGWGEFSLRAQVHFKDTFNKPVDIIHCLKLDKIRKGVQTSGGETIIEALLIVEKEVVEDSVAKAELAYGFEAAIKDETTDIEHEECYNSEGIDFDVKEEPSFTIRDLIAHGHDYCAMMNHDDIKQEVQRDDELSSSAGNIKLEMGAVKVKVETIKEEKPAMTYAQWQASMQFVKEKHIWRAVEILAERFYSLCGAKRYPDLCFQVPSVQQFLTYEIGKQRAVEWSRASHIRRRLLSFEQFGIVPSTREILVYLRHNGFTPLHGVTSTFNCTTVSTPVSSLSLPPGSILALPEGDVWQVKRKTCELEDDVVDVECMDEAVQKMSNIILEDPRHQFVDDCMLTMVPSHKMPATSEARVLLLEMMTRLTVDVFAKDLLKHSLSESFKRCKSHHTIDGILPIDIHSAVCNQEHLDFLSNAGLGEEVIAEDQ